MVSNSQDTFFFGITRCVGQEEGFYEVQGEKVWDFLSEQHSVTIFSLLKIMQKQGLHKCTNRPPDILGAMVTPHV